MAKHKKKRKKSPEAAAAARPMSWGGGYSAKQRRRDYLIMAAVLVVALAGGGSYWWRTAGVGRDFDQLVAAGQGSLARVKTIASRGRDHFSPGTPYAYPSRFPTSGAHATATTAPGFYDTAQPPTLLVHAVEHGNIVIYYGDGADPSVLETLRDWTDLYDGRYDGVVAVPMTGLDDRVVLTAWTKRLNLRPFEPAAAAAFIDAYRGRGPEHPVR